MNKVLSVNVDDFDCTVEAGVYRKQLNNHLKSTGLWFPIDPGGFCFSLLCVLLGKNNLIDLNNLKLMLA